MKKQAKQSLNYMKSPYTYTNRYICCYSEKHKQKCSFSTLQPLRLGFSFSQHSWLIQNGTKILFWKR